MSALARHAVSVACVVVAALVACVFGGRELSVVRVAGGSMYPALRAGDLCLVRKGGRFELQDIVLFEQPSHGARVLHRVTSIGPSGIVTQGDANPVPDFEPVSRRSVIGRVSAVVPVGSMLERVAARFRRW